MEPYYTKYDDHYRALYAQGIRYWADGPDHCQKSVAEAVSLLSALVPDPTGRVLLDIGCGEGQLAAPICALGFTYVGVDVSEAAIARARERVAGQGPRAWFCVADAVRADDAVFRQPYDIILDQACFHMLVVDADCRRYLSNVRRMMYDRSGFLMLRQAWQEDAYDGPVRSVGDYESLFRHDLSKPKVWDQVWNGERWVKMELPSFAARPRPRNGYVREVEDAGFVVDKVLEHPERGMLDLVLRKAGTPA